MMGKYFDDAHALWGSQLLGQPVEVTDSEDVAAARKKAGITVLTRPSAALRIAGAAARRQTELLLASEGLYSLALPVPRPAGSFMRQTPLCID